MRDDLLLELIRQLIALNANLSRVLSTQPEPPDGKWLSIRAVADILWGEDDDDDPDPVEPRKDALRVKLRRWCATHLKWCAVCKTHSEKGWCEVREKGSEKPTFLHMKQTAFGVRQVETDEGTHYEVHENLLPQWRARHEETRRPRKGVAS